MSTVNTSRGREILWEEGEAKDFESFFFFLNLQHVGIVLVRCVSLRINVIFIGNCSRNN